jgi:hypothetical protein
MSRTVLLTMCLAVALAAGGCEPEPVAGTGTVADPVQIPPAPPKAAVDGDLSEWSSVGVLPMPSMESPTSPVRLGWSKAGLYGAVRMADDEVTAPAGLPYTGDCIEVFIEKDFARAEDRSQNTAQYVFAASGEGEAGPCVTAIYGADQGNEAALKSAWKKAAGGYVIEFLIPASILNPAKMAAGTKIGLNFSLNDNGEPVGQFFVDKNDNRAFRDPSRWGAAVLAE